jgi:hypothetical protein
MEISGVKSRWLDENTPEGRRRAATIAVVLSVLLLGLGAWNLWDGDVVAGVGCIFGAVVVLTMVFVGLRSDPGRGR